MYVANLIALATLFQRLNYFRVETLLWEPFKRENRFLISYFCWYILAIECDIEEKSVKYKGLAIPVHMISTSRDLQHCVTREDRTKSQRRRSFKHFHPILLFIPSFLGTLNFFLERCFSASPRVSILLFFFFCFKFCGRSPALPLRETAVIYVLRVHARRVITFFYYRNVPTCIECAPVICRYAPVSPWRSSFRGGTFYSLVIRFILTAGRKMGRTREEDG